MPAFPRLTESALAADPIEQFQRWFKDALAAGLPGAEAMTLATATPEGKPSARMVLLKGADKRGFRFFTNYRSRKGRELAENPVAALVFYWEMLGRQVRVEGKVVRVPPEESDEYFDSRTLENKISSLTSLQSAEARAEELDSRFDGLMEEFRGRSVPRPAWWGGYRLVPEKIEFWQRRFARLDDRLLYTQAADGSWNLVRLSP